MKGALKAAAAIAVLAVLAWTGTYLYWHVRILAALRTLESHAGWPTSSPSANEADNVVNEAGCRAFPAMVAALDPGKNPYFLFNVTAKMAIQVAAPGERDPLPSQAISDQLGEWRIQTWDSVQERTRKCDVIRSWWKLHGSEYHQTWRVWSRACAAK
jgi:hypothetical protein